MEGWSHIREGCLEEVSRTVKLDRGSEARIPALPDIAGKYIKTLPIVYQRFKLNYMSCISSGNSTAQFIPGWAFLLLLTSPADLNQSCSDFVCNRGFHCSLRIHWWWWLRNGFWSLTNPGSNSSTRWVALSRVTSFAWALVSSKVKLGC